MSCRLRRYLKLSVITFGSDDTMWVSDIYFTRFMTYKNWLNENLNVIINITFHSMEVEYPFLIPGRIRLHVTGLEWCCFNISFASSCLLLLALVVILSCSIVLFLLLSLYRVFLFRLLFVDSNLFLNLRFSTDIFLSLSTEGRSLLVNIKDLSLYDLVRLLADVAESFLV